MRFQNQSLNWQAAGCSPAPGFIIHLTSKPPGTDSLEEKSLGTGLCALMGAKLLCHPETGTLWSNHRAQDALQRVRACVIHPSIPPSIHLSALHTVATSGFAIQGRLPGSRGYPHTSWAGDSDVMGNSPMPWHEPRDNSSTGEPSRVPSHTAVISPLLWRSPDDSNTRSIQH